MWSKMCFIIMYTFLITDDDKKKNNHSHYILKNINLEKEVNLSQIGSVLHSTSEDILWTSSRENQ